MSYNNTNMQPFLLPFVSNNNESLKNNHDYYDIYVNEEFVGKKMLLTEKEDISDVNDFLEKQGYNNISTQLDGDHYVIRANDEEEARRLKETLSIYLHIR